MRPRALLAPALAALVLLAGVPAQAADVPVRIALLDSGIAPGHSEFAPGQVVGWQDFVNGRAAPYDDHGHGTAVASRAAGRTLGAYPGASLLIGKVLSAADFAAWSDVAEGIAWAADQGADVISISIWNCFPQLLNNPFVASAIHDATQQGSLVVWIAGNGGNPGFCGSLLMPSPMVATVLVGGSSPEALVVGAANAAGNPAGFSNKDPEVLAEGVNVPIARADGSIGTGSGTSFAAPWVAGVVARMRADGAPRDPGWLKWVLLHSARDGLNPYPLEGYGFLDAGAVAKARAVARGEQPVPGLDDRDAAHLAMALPRVAQTQQLPAGALPPG